MGMAMIEKQITYGEMLHSTNPNLNHCNKCDAVYKPSKHWARGCTDSGTAGQFYPQTRIPEHKCPICLTPNKET